MSPRRSWSCPDKTGAVHVVLERARMVEVRRQEPSLFVPTCRPLLAMRSQESVSRDAALYLINIVLFRGFSGRILSFSISVVQKEL